MNPCKRLVAFLSSCYLKLILRCKVSCNGFVRSISTISVASSSTVKIGKSAHLNKAIFLMSPDNSLEIGVSSHLNNVKFHLSGVNAKVIIGDCCTISNTTFWIEDQDCTIQIGDSTYIGGVHIAVTGNGKSVTIGRDSMLSDGIVIRTGDSHAIVDEKSGKKINLEQDVFIDEHVWIAQNSTILKGSRIGRDSVIGCNSLVSGSFESNSLIAGVPARVMKSEVNWNKDRMLE